MASYSCGWSDARPAYVGSPYGFPDDRSDDRLDSPRSEFSVRQNPQVSKLDVFKIRAKQVGLVALAVITAIVLSPVLLPVAIVGGIAFGGFAAISSLASKVRQENQRLQDMRAAEESAKSPVYRFGY